MTEHMNMAEFRKQLANGDLSLRGRGRRGLPEHVQDAGHAAMIAEDEAKAAKAKRSTARGSGGTPTTVDGIRFPSIMEAHVYQRLKLLAKAEGATLYRQVRYALTNIAPREDGRPRYLTIDFLLVYPDRRHRFIDAKAKRWQSPEWGRGKAAFEAEYGYVVEECEK